MLCLVGNIYVQLREVNVRDEVQCYRAPGGFAARFVGCCHAQPERSVPCILWMFTCASTRLQTKKDTAVPPTQSRSVGSSRAKCSRVSLFPRESLVLFVG